MLTPFGGFELNCWSYFRKLILFTGKQIPTKLVFLSALSVTAELAIGAV
jgi:hypothetical protein